MKSLSFRFIPERRLDAKFINGLNEAAQIMAQDFAQNFVNLRRAPLASEAFAELRLDHAERRLDVAALVVVLLKDRLVELVQVIHTLPQFAFAGGVRLPLLALAERDVRDAALDKH